VYTLDIVKKPLLLSTLLVAFAFQARSDEPHGDSEFVFARVQFTMSLEALFEAEAPWHHDYPFSEHFYLGILREVTSLRTTGDAYEIVQLGSDDIFRYPFLYVSEPGFMQLTPGEVENLGEYLDRGGFIMFDDFRGEDFYVLQAYLQRAFPDREMFRLDATHPLYSAFYTIDSLDSIEAPYMDARFSGNPEFWGMHDDRGRLMFVANHNNDIGEFWEGLDRADDPLRPAIDAVRLGVNYMIYSMTH
jgi:hypothetical protein